MNLFIDVPDHWEISRVDRVATTNARIGWKALTAAEYQDDGYAFLATPNIKNTEIDFENVNFISEFRYRESPQLQLAEGDVLLTKDGFTLGTVNVVKGLPRPATVNGSIAVLRPFAIHSGFLRYVIACSVTQGHIQAAKDGMDVLHLFQRDIRKLPIPVPPAGEQRRIADFLDMETRRIDRMQSRTRRQVLLLAEHLNESIRVATTVGAGPRQSTGIDWMPDMNEQWRIFKIGHVFRTGSGTTPTSDRTEYFDGPYPWVNSSDINDGEIVKSDKSVTLKALSDFSALKIYPTGSVVVALYGQGATKGKVGILRINACMNQACCALIPIGPVIEGYAAYWFRAHKQGIVGLALGAGQPNLSQELIRQLHIPAPDCAAQHQIVAELQQLEEAVRSRTAILRTRERLLGERRAALITAAVTGQIDVSTASGRGIED